ncbi:hypothetical protein Bca4012_036064 [Brassica carinata]
MNLLYDAVGKYYESLIEIPKGEEKTDPAWWDYENVPIRHTLSPTEMYERLVSRLKEAGSWTIKVRVTNKGVMRNYRNARGEVCVFNVELTDEEGTQIQATMFNDAGRKFYDRFQLGKVYYISMGSLKLANKQFKTVQNDYEMTLAVITTIKKSNVVVHLVQTGTHIAETRLVVIIIRAVEVTAADHILHKVEVHHMAQVLEDLAGGYGVGTPNYSQGGGQYGGFVRGQNPTGGARNQQY